MNSNGDFYCLNCLHLLEQKINLNFFKKYVKIKIFYGILMPSEQDNILQFYQYMKSDKMSYIIYADMESFMKNRRCEDNPENASTKELRSICLVDIQTNNLSI